jgi:hypothetical protein
MKKIITIYQKEEWIGYVSRSFYYDFYHTWTYHFLENTGSPLLFVFEEKDDFIAIPFLKQKVPESGFYDISSVYGFVGPIANKSFEDFNENFLDTFKSSLQAFLDEEKIITIFSRLHPFINQSVLLKRFGGVYDNGKIVVMDLTIALNVQRAKYPKVYSKIRQLKHKGYHLKEGDTIEDIRVFLSIYKENMSRLNASNSYMFSEEYLITLLNSKEYDARLYFVNNEMGDPICGTIIIFTNQLIQGHLIATKEEYRSVSPAKLLVDEVTLIGREKGMKYYNLGGGLGYKEDTLYQWKLTFSNLTFHHKTWRYISDESAYNNILDQYDIDKQSNIDFFPLYRSSLKTV